MKYELTTNTKTFNGIILYQIKALKDFGIIKNGSLGGWIEKIENLSQDGNAWVYKNARVSGNARVSENARVSGNALVYENARVSGNALVYENAMVYGNAWVYKNARVYGNAWVYKNARVYGNAMVSGNALVYENAMVYGNALVYENARVYGNAMVSGNAWVYENARVNQSILLSSGLTNFDCSQNLLGTIRNSLNLMPVNGELLFYKRVRSDLSSEFDSSFYYKIGEEVVVEDFHPDTSISCGKGIHGSHANYYPLEENKVILALSSKIEDIICCQQGKIRVKKAKVLGICDV